MKMRVCKYCGCKTKNASEICSSCNEKLRLIRQIRAMLMPYKIRKDEKAKLGGSDGKSEKGV